MLNQPHALVYLKKSEILFLFRYYPPPPVAYPSPYDEAYRYYGTQNPLNAAMPPVPFLDPSQRTLQAELSPLLAAAESKIGSELVPLYSCFRGTGIFAFLHSRLIFGERFLGTHSTEVFTLRIINSQLIHGKGSSSPQIYAHYAVSNNSALGLCY